MRIAGPRTLVSAVLALALCGSLLASSARAQGPEFVALSQGAFPQLGYTWQGIALRPNAVSLDLYNAEGALFQSYTPVFAQAPPKRSLSALGYRPVGLPTTAALVAGVAGTRVKTVKLFFSGAPAQKLRPVPAPAEWGFRARFFGAGAIVSDAFANTTTVVTKIKALDRKGKLLTTLQNVFTNPF